MEGGIRLVGIRVAMNNGVQTIRIKGVYRESLDPNHPLHPTNGRHEYYMALTVFQNGSAEIEDVQGYMDGRPCNDQHDESDRTNLVRPIHQPPAPAKVAAPAPNWATVIKSASQQ
eukprot:TRINITY_DN3949_c0_g1_i2.p1 TRINITY_DN3949_c0_g1~~TRINITY_DN3949_c0_g1_i2.p1  ORF type:complete len:115 (-),score=22.12 TRINITY_DN3949_c0_g1_i2:84-428(-)